MNWITCWWTEITWSTFHDRQMTIQIKKSGCKAPSSPSLSMDHSRVEVPRNAQHHNANPRPNRRLGNWPQKVADTQQALQSSKFLYQKSNVWHVSSIISCFQSWHNRPQFFLLIPNHFNKNNPSAMPLACYLSRTSTFWPPSHHILSPTIAHEAGRLQLSHVRIHELISRFSIFPPEKMTTSDMNHEILMGFLWQDPLMAHFHPQPKWVV